jgi:hypothetical protein
VYATTRAARYSRGAGPRGGDSGLFPDSPRPAMGCESGVVTLLLSRIAIRSPNSGQYRADTTATVTKATMKNSPPLKPNTALPE